MGTIRTQLQARRAQLGKEITVEQEITRGSRKLAKMYLVANDYININNGC